MKLLYLCTLLLLPFLSYAQVFDLKTGDSLDKLNYTIDTLEKRWGIVMKNVFTKDYKAQKILINLPYFATKGGYTYHACIFTLYSHRIEKIMLVYSEPKIYPDLYNSLRFKYGKPETFNTEASLWLLKDKGVNIYLSRSDSLVGLQYENRELLGQETAEKSNDL